MAVLHIRQFHGKTAVLDSEKEALAAVDGKPSFAIGTDIKNSSIIQITSQPDAKSITGLIDVLGRPDTSLQIAILPSASNPDGPISANVVEYVQSTFPISSFTADFRSKIESDFMRFESIYAKEPIPGHRGWTAGWTAEDEDHEAIAGEKTRCFVVIRGWDSMAAFESALETPAFKEAIPILYGWKAPFKMVSPFQCFLVQW